jgi:alpha-glucosidase
MTLNFPLLRAFTHLDTAIARELWEWDAKLPTDGWLGNFVSNHDLAADRPGTLFAGNSEKLRAQTAWLLLGPGTPFIYYGNEIGQPQGTQRGDTRYRQPLNWEELARQRDDHGSIWHWHQRLIQVRRDHLSLRRGKVHFLETDTGNKVLALWREADAERTLTILSGSADPLPALTVKVPPDLPGRPVRWVLGSGPTMANDDGTFKLGPWAPFESKVLLWSK